MATYTELREAYINGMTSLSVLKGLLSRELLVTLSNAWYEAKKLAEQAHYAEWVATNPEAVQSLETAVAAHEASFTANEQGGDGVDDYYSQYPGPRDFGYQEADWPDFGIESE